MSAALHRLLESFASSHEFTGNKGPLCVALVVTRMAVRHGLPLEASALVTIGQGQVVGLGKGAVQSILKDYGITRVLAAEGGRTSRGSMKNMQDYVAFLNGLPERAQIDLKAVEQWWVAKVVEYFERSPLRLRLDVGTSLKACLSGLFEEARRRQSVQKGSTLLGGMMQHLVGAKPDTLYPGSELRHNSFSTADDPTGRAGDFEIGDSVIHVTTAPTRQLLGKCSANLERGLRPLVISSQAGAALAESLAEEMGIGRRVEVLEITQFLVANMLERTKGDREDSPGLREFVRPMTRVNERTMKGALKGRERCPETDGPGEMARPISGPLCPFSPLCPLGSRRPSRRVPLGPREYSSWEVGSLGLEPRTNGLKVRCSTD